MKVTKIFFGNYFKLYATLLIVFSIYSITFPDFRYFSPEKPPYWGWMKEKLKRKDKIFESVQKLYPPDSHMSKTEFRLVVPILAWLFHINSCFGLYFLQCSLGIIFIYLLLDYILRLTNDKFISFFIAMSFGFIYAGFSFFADTFGAFDPFCYFFVFIAFYSRVSLVVYFALLLAFFTDERSILSGLLLLFYWQLCDINNSTIKRLLLSNNSLVFLASFISFLILRFLLVHDFHFVNQFGGTGIKIIKTSIDFLPIVLWQSFYGFWPIVLLSFYYLWLDKRWLIFFIFLLINFLIILASLFVLDLTRSVGYVFPSIFISIYIIRDKISIQLLKQLVSISFVICLFNPKFYFSAPSFYIYYEPSFIWVIKMITFH